MLIWFLICGFKNLELHHVTPVLNLSPYFLQKRISKQLDFCLNCLKILHPHRIYSYHFHNSLSPEALHGPLFFILIDGVGLELSLWYRRQLETRALRDSRDISSCNLYQGLSFSAAFPGRLYIIPALNWDEHSRSPPWALSTRHFEESPVQGLHIVIHMIASCQRHTLPHSSCGSYGRSVELSEI